MHELVLSWTSLLPGESNIVYPMPFTQQAWLSPSKTCFAENSVTLQTLAFSSCASAQAQQGWDPGPRLASLEANGVLPVLSSDQCGLFFFFCNFFMGTKIFEDWGREKDGVPLLRFCAQGIVSHHSVLTSIIFFNICKPPHTCLILTEGPAKWSRPSLLTSIYRDALSCWEIWN